MTRFLLKGAPLVVAFAAAAEEPPAARLPVESPEAIACLAALAAGGTDAADPATGEPLAASAPVRAGALVWLGRTGHPEALPILSRALAEEDPEVRLAAVRGLRALGDPAAEEALIVALSRARLSRQARAYEYATLDPTDPEVPLRKETAERIDVVDPDLAARQEAAWALAEIGGGASARALVSALAAEPAALAATAESALEILANRSFRGAAPNDPSARAEIWRAWLAAHENEARADWVLAGFRDHLGGRGVDIPDLESPAAVEAFVGTLAAEEPWIRANAVDRLHRWARLPRDAQTAASALDLLARLAGDGGLAAASAGGGDSIDAFLQEAARRQFARAYYRVAAAWFLQADVPDVGPPPGGLLEGLAPQAPHPRVENAVEAIDALSAWWARARSRSPSR